MNMYQLNLDRQQTNRRRNVIYRIYRNLIWSEFDLSEPDLSQFRAGGNENWVHPLRFATDVLGVDPWEKQREVLDAVMRERRVAVKSGNGLGKDFIAAVAVLWYLHCHDPAIVLSTAPTFRQVRHVLWRQIHRLHRGAAGILGGTMLDTRWDLAEDRYALGLSADGADQFQGFHCPNVLVIVDEAEGVDEEIYEAIDSVMTSQNPTLLLIGNPTSTSGAVPPGVPRGDRHLPPDHDIGAGVAQREGGPHRNCRPDHGGVGGGTPRSLGREQRPVPLPGVGRVPAARGGQLDLNGGH